jgi:hypothetical protein
VLEMDTTEKDVAKGVGIPFRVDIGMRFEIAEHGVDRTLLGDGQQARIEGAVEVALLLTPTEDCLLSCVEVLVVV